MKRLSKVILIALAILLLVATLAAGSLWFYLRSDDARARLEVALGKALKLPLRFQHVDVAFPLRIRATGVSTAEGTAPGDPKLTAAALRGTLALRPLLSGTFELSDVALEQPTFDWPQSKSGQWTWPSDRSKEEKKPKTARVPDSTATPKVKTPESEKAPPESKRASVLVRGVKILGGTVHLLDEKALPVFSASGLTANFTEITGQRLVGTIAAQQVVWREKFQFSELKTALTYGDDHLELKDLEAGIFDGKMNGQFTMDTAQPGQPFTTRLTVQHVDLAALAAASGWTEGETGGYLQGEADLRGRTDQMARLEGSCTASVIDGRFRRSGLLETIATVLNITELSNFRPTEASAKFNLRDEKTFIDSLVLATENLRLDARGMARFDGKLALDARLGVTTRMAQTLPDFALSSFTKVPSGGYALDFKIGGKIDKPKTDLAEKLIGGKVQDKVGDLLGTLFGTKPTKKSEKSEDKASRPAPAPEPAPRQP